ncbi:DUF3422 domain-containing protein [Methylocaldum sp.]|uniref:DUF3422 family protein n=1 Tax=Methylocaldum sp. TaxID=1969727 RepID=UPI002D5F0918|nr:DUF3422 domain-containing protein [Methylocaldum sp.]HYE35680.1 DUF3422 domain-containing protein [Methylocaldum sp.]
MIRLNQHPLRIRLHDEINARPYEPLESPERISYLAVAMDEQSRALEFAHLAELCRHFGQGLPVGDGKCYKLRLGELRIKVERHEEFTRYMFILRGAVADPFAETPIGLIPAEWVERIPGTVLVASHTAVLPGAEAADGVLPQKAAYWFPGGTVVGSSLANNAVSAFSDFRIHSDGFSRWILIDHCRQPAQVGRTLLRLLEIDTYRMLALLALPIARELIPQLRQRDRELHTLAQAVAAGSEKADESLLEELSRLAVDVENLISSHYYRFNASRAYFGLVVNRLEQLREARIDDISSLSGFLNRRLEPARNTCESVSRWLDDLSTRVTNASQLLRTRADVRREQQNQALLAALNRRSHLQLRLQQTVEGLSLAAITYAGVSLIGILGHALYNKGLFPFDSGSLEALVMPFVAAGVYLGTRHIREAVRESN